MSLASKAKMSFATVIGLVAVVAFWSVVSMRPSTNGNGPSSDNYTVSVKFEPSYVSNEVHISVKVDGVALINDTTRLSPWIRTMTAERGAMIILQAVSLDTDKLDCFISRNGAPVAFDDAETGFGTVTCNAL